MGTLDPVTGTVTSDLSNLANPPAPSPASPTVAAPEVSSTPPTLEPLPLVSFDEAKSRHAELWGDPSWVEKYMAGDREAARQQAQVWNSVNTSPPPPANERETILRHLQQSGPVSPAAEAEIMSGRASSPADVAAAKDWLRYLGNSAAWQQRERDGDPEILQKKNTANLILSRVVRDNPDQP